MASRDPTASAGMAAEQIVKGLGITTLPVDPFAIAKNREIEVVAKPPRIAGSSGMLIRSGENFVIAYSTHINNVAFQRYSVGHELGHYFLPGHVDAVIGANGIHVSSAEYRSKDQYEREADSFAASLLMPRYLFFPAMQESGDGLPAIERLADRCKTSLHATAIRYAKCTRDAMAIVISNGKQIDHCFMSERLKDHPGIEWMRKREVLPTASLTASFNQDANNVSGAARENGETTFSDWFGGTNRMKIREDVVGLGSYGMTLTILHDIDLPEDGDEDPEQSLVESYTPRFR